MPDPRWSDDQVEQVMGNMLRAGVLSAAAVVLGGGVWLLATNGLAMPNYRVFQGEPSDVSSLSGIVRGLLGRHPRNWIQFGLLLLIATPIARVIFSVYAFAREGDRTYVVITLIVLAVLLYSLSGGASL